MEDELLKNKNSSETFERIILVFVELLTIISAEVMTKAADGEQKTSSVKEYLYKLLLDKRYESFISDFNYIYSTENAKVSFYEDLCEINKILLSLNVEKVHKVYKIIKLVTISYENKQECEVRSRKGARNFLNRFKNYDNTDNFEQNKTTNLNNFDYFEIPTKEKEYVDNNHLENFVSSSKLVVEKEFLESPKSSYRIKFLKRKKKPDSYLEDDKAESSPSPSSIINNIENNFDINLQNEILSLQESKQKIHDELKSISTQSTQNKTLSTMNKEMKNITHTHIQFQIQTQTNSKQNPKNLQQEQVPKTKVREKLLNTAKLFHLPVHEPELPGTNRQKWNEN